MLQAAGQRLGPLDDHRLAVHVEPTCHHAVRPRAVERQTGDGQAPLLAVLRLVAQRQLGVDEVPDDVIDVVGEHPQADADLRGREPSTRGGEHRVGEVADEGPDLLVEVDHWAGDAAQDRVAEQPDVAHGHGQAPGALGGGPVQSSDAQPRSGGSTCTRTGACLRLLRPACSCCRARDSAAPRSRVVRTTIRASACCLSDTSAGPSTST